MGEGERVGGYSESGRGREGGRMYGEWVRERGWENIVRAGEGGRLGDIVRAGEGRRVGGYRGSGRGREGGRYSDSGRGREGGRFSESGRGRDSGRIKGEREREGE